MAIYDIYGNEIASGNQNPIAYVAVSDIKSDYPLYNDDQILDEAITRATELGGTTKIIWDGSDIHFDGVTAHTCKGFGGIDFNGSKIYMPNYDRGVIIQVEPENTSDITISSDLILKDRTTSPQLKGKVFTMNNGGKTVGNAGMCLGTRMRTPVNPDDVVYWSPTIITDPDGNYKTGELYLVPSAGQVECYNVHEIPPITFEICNATIVSYSGTVMSNFVLCTRSNTCIHGFRLEGTSGITAYRDGIFFCNRCCNIEIYDICGISPVQKDLSSGYSLYFRSVSASHIHDLFVGDSTRWGVIGCHFIIDCVFERCNLNRWDCHFAQTGFNVIRECVLGWLVYPVGCGIFTVENCIISNGYETGEGLIALRHDTPGVFDGEIIVKNCIFYMGDLSTTDKRVWGDGCLKEKPSNSVLVDAPLAKRVMDNCVIIGDYTTLFSTGTEYADDKPLFADLDIKIKNMDINASEAAIYAPSDLTIDKVAIYGCSITGAGMTLKNVRGDLTVTDSHVNSIATNSDIPNLVAVGNVFSGTQAVTRFNKYSLSGNIASDMNSVNRHS